MGFRYVIVDSNTSAILRMRSILEELEDFECISMCNSLRELQNTVFKHLPDIVIINVDETEDCPFKVIDELHQYLDTLPKIIGVSKTTEQAYKAIKSGFFDYWVLPLNEFEARKTLFKLKKGESVNPGPTTICLKSYKDYHYLNTDEILYLKADNNATDFFMKDGRKISAYKTLKSFEQKLPENFMRVHQSYIINSKYVSRINYGKSICTLKNDTNGLPFSKSYKEKIDELKALLSKNAINTLSQ